MDNEVFSSCMVDYNIFICTLTECVRVIYAPIWEFCREDLWSLHANLFSVMQYLPETLESWQCLTWAALITVMACILIKSLFTCPGALWSLSGALVCLSTAALLVCSDMASLAQTAVPPSQSHGQHDKWHRTRRWTHPLQEQLSEIEMSHRAGKRQWVISKKVSSGYVFQALPPAPNEPAGPLHQTVHEVVSWPHPFAVNWCSQTCSLYMIPAVTYGGGKYMQGTTAGILKDYSCKAYKKHEIL